MEYKIIPMTAEHISDIAAIEKICFSSPWTEDGLREELTNELSHFIVAESDKAIGYIGVQEICGEGYVTNIAVLPEYRKNGIGRALMTKAIEGAEERHCDFLTLEVRESNCVAISLYESLGFKKAGIRKNFYSSPTENAILYTINF